MTILHIWEGKITINNIVIHCDGMVYVMESRYETPFLLTLFSYESGYYCIISHTDVITGFPDKAGREEENVWPSVCGGASSV